MASSRLVWNGMECMHFLPHSDVPWRPRIRPTQQTVSVDHVTAFILQDTQRVFLSLFFPLVQKPRAVTCSIVLFLSLSLFVGLLRASFLPGRAFLTLAISPSDLLNYQRALPVIVISEPALSLHCSEEGYLFADILLGVLLPFHFLFALSFVRENLSVSSSFHRQDRDPTNPSNHSNGRQIPPRPSPWCKSNTHCFLVFSAVWPGLALATFLAPTENSFTNTTRNAQVGEVNGRPYPPSTSYFQNSWTDSESRSPQRENYWPTTSEDSSRSPQIRIAAPVRAASGTWTFELYVFEI